MTYVPPELPAEIAALVTAETPESVTLSVQISKALLLRQIGVLERLVDAASRNGVPPAIGDDE
jgi:hypothetical protein